MKTGPPDKGHSDRLLRKNLAVLAGWYAFRYDRHGSVSLFDMCSCRLIAVGMPFSVPRHTWEAYRHVQQEPLVLAHHASAASKYEQYREAIHDDVDRRRNVKFKGERSEESVVEAEAHLFRADGRIK